MTVKPSYTGVSSGSSASAQPMPYWFWPSAGLAGNLALVMFGAWLFSGQLMPLVLAAQAGALIGWLHRAWRMKSRWGESFVSALFGAGWDKENGALVVLDIASRALVGYSVGLAFASFATVAPEAFAGVSTLLGGGGGPLGGPSGWEWVLVLLYLFLVASGLLGAVAMLCGEGAVRELVYRGAVRAPEDAVGGASKSLVREAAKALAAERYGAGLGATALKGAVSGVITGVVLLVVGVRA